MVGYTADKKDTPGGGPEVPSKRLSNNQDLLDDTAIEDQSQAKEYSPQAVKIASEFINASDDVKRDIQYLIGHSDELPAAAPDGWQPLTITDFYAPREPVKEIVKGILRPRTLTIPYGAPGDLKTMLFMDQVVCIAMGKPWLPPAPWQSGGKAIPTLQCPVIWIDQDMGNDKILERFAALCKQHKAPPDLPLKVYSFQNPPLDASDPASIAILAARATGAGLIVIDNLGTISGEAEENASTMRLVMANLRWLAEETGAAVIVIHHQRKSNGISGRAGDALRGHSSIEAALDLALHISREPYSDQITIKSTKTRAREVAPFTAYFSYTQDDNGDLETAQFYSVEPEDNLSSYAIEREIKAALKTEAMTQSALWQAVKSELPEVGKPRILDMIRQLEDSGAIRMTPGMKNAKVYTLPANRVSSS